MYWSEQKTKGELGHFEINENGSTHSKSHEK